MHSIPKPNLETVALQKATASAARSFIARYNDPIWYDLPDLVNDLLLRFLAEHGILVSLTERDDSEES